MNGSPSQKLVRVRYCTCGHIEAWHAMPSVDGGPRGACRYGCGCEGFHSKRHGGRIVSTSEPMLHLEHKTDSPLQDLIEQWKKLRAMGDAWAASASSVLKGEPRPVSTKSIYESARSFPKHREVREPSGKLQIRVLAALIVHANGRATREHLALLCGYSPRAGHWGNTLSAMRAADLLDANELLSVTAKGSDLWRFAGSPKPPAPLDIWRDKLQPAHMRIVDAVLRAPGKNLTRDEIAQAVGLQPSAGHFGNLLSRVTSLGLLRRADHAYIAANALSIGESK